MNPLLHRQAWLENLLSDNGVVEIRHLDNGRVQSGIFDSIHEIRKATHGAINSGNIYCSLNAPRLRKVTNRLERVGAGACLADSDIVQIRRIPFDFDPTRPPKTASTAEELKLALDARNRFAEFLHARGWPIPCFALSGNGYHATYRTRLPNNADTAALLSRLYLALQRLFQTDDVGFDTSVRNPSRIFRLYGTINRKGANTEDRPHRRSNCWVPSPYGAVSLEQIQALADEIAPIQQAPTRAAPKRRYSGSGGDYATLDVVRWFQSHGHYRKYLRSYRGAAMHSVLCPWRDEHTTGSQGTVILESPDGWPGFRCQHSHCQGRTIVDVMDIWGDASEFCAARFGGSRR